MMLVWLRKRSRRISRMTRLAWMADSKGWCSRLTATGSPVRASSAWLRVRGWALVLVSEAHRQLPALSTLCTLNSLVSLVSVSSLHSRRSRHSVCSLLASAAPCIGASPLHSSPDSAKAAHANGLEVLEVGWVAPVHPCNLALHVAWLRHRCSRCSECSENAHALFNLPHPSSHPTRG
eukprot:m.78103 g.78103  ORF g.78103 m.78103 type:complete len:178 (-) comp8155_c0_seq3:84-617(-)